MLFNEGELLVGGKQTSNLKIPATFSKRGGREHGRDLDQSFVFLVFSQDEKVLICIFCNTPLVAISLTTSVRLALRSDH